MIVVAGPASPMLSAKIADLLDAKLITPSFKTFPDGESYIRIDNPKTLKGETVVIVNTMYPDQNRRVIELLLMASIARDYDCDKLYTVVPYMAYARQDKRFLEGEAISLKVLAEIIGKVSDKVVTVDLHSPETISFFGKNATNVTAMNDIGNFLSENYSFKNPLVIGPDQGALEYAKTVANILGAEYSYCEKMRDRYTGEITMSVKDIDVKNRDVIIVDDIISTGGTVALASTNLRKMGATNIVACCTHALMVGEAEHKIISSGVSEILSTDTIECKYTRISVAKTIASEIRKL